jgi:uncharacterized protein (TIGR02996 family)
MPHADFWHAIHETPEDDTPRFVYADWLDDHGDRTAPTSFAWIEWVRLSEDDPQRRSLGARIGLLQEVCS